MTDKKRHYYTLSLKNIQFHAEKSENIDRCHREQAEFGLAADHHLVEFLYKT
jgi:hypothetical protein